MPRRKPRKAVKKYTTWREFNSYAFSVPGFLSSLLKNAENPNKALKKYHKKPLSEKSVAKWIRMWKKISRKKYTYKADSLRILEFLAPLLAGDRRGLAATVRWTWAPQMAYYG